MGPSKTYVWHLVFEGAKIKIIIYHPLYFFKKFGYAAMVLRKNLKSDLS